MSALGAGYVIDQIINPSDAGPGTPTWDELVPRFQDIKYMLQVLDDALQNADAVATSSVTVATDAATQAEKIGQNVKDIVHHTYDVVIPHSLSWLAGYIVSHFITPIHERLDKDESNIRFLLGWRAQIVAWRNEFVDPNIELWVGFRKFFDGWPQGVLFRWHDYFEHPGNFADWAAPPLIGPLVSYLAAPEHKTTRDALASIMVNAWTEETNTVWESVLRWAVSDK